MGPQEESPFAPVSPVIPTEWLYATVYGLATAFLSYALVCAIYALVWWYRERKFSMVKLIFSLLPISTAGALKTFFPSSVFI